MRLSGETFLFVAFAVTNTGIMPGINVRDDSQLAWKVCL
jgi:hypothetical protein